MIETLIYLASLTSFVFNTEICKENEWNGYHKWENGVSVVGLCTDKMNKEQLIKTLIHELGHVLYYTQGVQWKGGGEIQDHYRKNSMVNKEEDFADTFMSLFFPSQSLIYASSEEFKTKQDKMREIINELDF